MGYIGDKVDLHPLRPHLLIQDGLQAFADLFQLAGGGIQVRPGTQGGADRQVPVCHGPYLPEELPKICVEPVVLKGPGGGQKGQKPAGDAQDGQLVCPVPGGEQKEAEDAKEDASCHQEEGQKIFCAQLLLKGSGALPPPVQPACEGGVPPDAKETAPDQQDEAAEKEEGQGEEEERAAKRQALQTVKDEKACQGLGLKDHRP